MNSVDLLRPSRDGDQFHYLWAARRILPLLSATSGLVAVSVEGASPNENVKKVGNRTADRTIDIAEYYGSERLEQAVLIRYVQLKHSTLQIDKAWTASGLKTTLKGFAQKYASIRDQLPNSLLNKKVEFCFTTNRQLNIKVKETIEDIANNNSPKHPRVASCLKRYTALVGSQMSDFFSLLKIQDDENDFWEQRNLLFQDVGGYLPDFDYDAPIQLKELITRKATSEYSHNPVIKRSDVLRALKTDETRLFPAPCKIEELTEPVVRIQEQELIESIVGSPGKPIIVHAAAGVGKTVFASRVKYFLPEGSVSVLYDCFANGEYRSASGYRHRHQDALVQIANEIFSQGFCHPLIPTPNADSSDYVRAFLNRLNQASSLLKAATSSGLLCLLVDAGDNAQYAALEIGESKSFIVDLIREELPENVRLIVLCRSHRRDQLNPPANTLALELTPFAREETAIHLRSKFPDSTEEDVDEFHRLSSQNPRVQALAFSKGLRLHSILRMLGPNPTTVEDTIEKLLNDAIEKLRDLSESIDKNQIDAICAGLAVLRPLIPIPVLAAMSNVSSSAIESFAIDIGRPLLVIDSTIQFLDEPAESWFRQKFRPEKSTLYSFIQRLDPLASNSAYVASTLPQIMLEAGQFTELVDLAISSKGLPETNPLEKRDIELQRLKFSLKASLRMSRYVDACKLAFKAGREAAGDDRQRKLLQDNTDLVATFLESNSIQEMVSRKTFESGWMGSHHVYEAAILSEREGLIGDARSRLRMAENWLSNWAKLPAEDRDKEEVSDLDRAEMALAHFNIHGAKLSARSLRLWTPREISYRAGRILARRFIDFERYKDLDDLALAAGNDISLIFGIAVELQQVHRSLPERVIARASKLIASQHFNVRDSSHSWEVDSLSLLPVLAIVEMDQKLSIGSNRVAAQILAKYLPSIPPRDLCSRFSGTRSTYLRAYCFHAALVGKDLGLLDLAHDELKKELEAKNRHSDSREAREIKEFVGALLPWQKLWAQVFLGEISDDELGEKISQAKEQSGKAVNIHYEAESNVSDEIAKIWFDILIVSETQQKELFLEFDSWASSLRRALYIPTWVGLARLAARNIGQTARALEYASRAFTITKAEKMDAEEKATTYISISRSIVSCSRSEANSYFDKAVEVASKIGDENLYRWEAILGLAKKASSSNNIDYSVPYNFSRCAELTYDYVVRDKHFPWDETVTTLATLCPSSCISILSRWRDRRFGWQDRMLPVAIEHLIESKKINPLNSIVLLCIRGHWDEPTLLNSAMSESSSIDQKKEIAEFVFRYHTLNDGHNARSLQSLRNELKKFNIVLEDLEERIRGFDEIEPTGFEENTYGSTSFREEQITQDWDQVFDSIDVSIPNELSFALNRFREGEPPYYIECFFDQMFQRVQAGREIEFIHSISNAPEFGIYELGRILQQVPDNWQSRVAIIDAISELIKVHCRRHCESISKNRYYNVFPWELACEMSGMTEADICKIVLKALGESGEFIRPTRLFSLIELLAIVMSPDEAESALRFGLSVFDGDMEEEDGDGPWNSSLVPPLDVSRSIAGYIWSRLGSPVATERWEAAHVVFNLCKLGRSEMIDHIVSFTNSSSSKAFTDARFQFYDLHAKQWLLIGLARAAHQYAAHLIPHISYFIRESNEGANHVLLRMLASRILLSLADSDANELSPEDKIRLRTINVSQFPVDPEGATRTIPDNDSVESEEDLYYFGIDFGPYWLAPLGRRFGLSEKQIERETIRTIRDELDYIGKRSIEDDERAQIRVYGNDMETYHSHGSSPRVDDLRFYHSYHAMFITAGKLLRTVPLVREPYEEGNAFLEWLSEYDLTRSDQRWLADRRDPFPLNVHKWPTTITPEEWRWSVSRDYFEKLLFIDKEKVVVWGNWEECDDRNLESVSIRSAFVCHDKSISLLSALQSTLNSHDYLIPDAEEDHKEIDENGFKLTGWVNCHTRDCRLDEFDPWGGAIRYPAPSPSSHVVEEMNLKTDFDSRHWYDSDSDELALQSEIWGSIRDSRDEEEKRSGNRLFSTQPFLASLVKKFDMDLVFEVSISRRPKFQKYSKSDDNEFRFYYPYARVFLFRTDGKFYSG